jgi:NADH:ubiquinone oxidoreductase subunit F (NADH-binding)
MSVLATQRPTGTARLLAAAAADLDTHARHNGRVPWLGGPRRLLPVVEASGLTGRGGAGFPTWRKLAEVARGDRPVVVGNGSEGEPASAKDRTLLLRAPHLVLDGLQLAAECVGAEHAYLYLPAGDVTAAAQRAQAQRQGAGWDLLRVELVAAPDRFVAGEASAVVAAVEGRPAVPRDKARRVSEAGVHGRPTLVQNIETLAHLALIARYGAGWFRIQGTADEPGTFLATVTGAVRAPGVYEAPYGVPLAALLRGAGGPAAPLRAVLVGGFHGAWVPAAAVGVGMSRAALGGLGAAPGAGIVRALPTARCGLVEAAQIAGYLAGQSAAQCGPCVNGLPRMADTLHRLARREPDPRLPGEVHRLAGLVERRGACHHPDGTARFVRSSLATFADDVRAHLTGHCLADQ